MALKKKFVSVELPLIEEQIEILGEKETLPGKTIKLDLTRKLRGRSLEVVFKIYNKENKIIGLPKQMNLMKFYIRRMMRKGTNYVEDSFKTNCKDVEVTIKPFLITRKRVSRAVRNNLRRTAKDFLINYLKEKNYIEVCSEILTSDLQRTMLPKLKKVYPLSFCEIRVFETNSLEKADLVKVEKKFENEEDLKVEEIQPELVAQPAQAMAVEEEEAEKVLEEAKPKKAAKIKKEKPKKE